MTTSSAATWSDPSLREGPDLRATIEHLLDAAKRARSLQAFSSESLAIIAAAFESPYAAIELRCGPIVIQHAHEPDAASPGLWKHTVDAMLTEALAQSAPCMRVYQGRDKAGRLALLSTLLGSHAGVTSGAVALVSPCADEDQARRLHAALGALSVLASRLADAISDDAGTSRAIDTSGASAMRSASRYASLRELARAITERVRTRERCEQVTLGLALNRRVKILATSGRDETSHTAGARSLRAAMEECLDAGAILVAQNDDEELGGGIRSGYRLHRDWQASTGGAAVASIALNADDRCVAVLSVRRSASASFTAEELSGIKALVEPYAPALVMVERATRTLGQHAKHALQRSLGDLTSKEAWLKRSAVLATLIALTWAGTSSVTYRVSVPASIAPVEVRQVTSPHDGILRAVHVAPGDLVAAGNVLFEFDTSSLELERARLQRDLDLRSLEASRALAAGTPVEIQLARAGESLARAAIDVVEQRIREATITAPTAGVIGGRLRLDRLGDTFAKGAALCEISSSGRWLLELEIPESDVSLVRSGTVGRFSSFARPEDEHRFHVTSIEPRASRRDGAAVFLATASTDVQDDWVRPGMAGVARLDLGERSLWWASTHRVVDYLRFKLWL